MIASRFHLCYLPDDVVMLVSLNSDLQVALRWFTIECEAAGMRISTSKSEVVILSRKRVDWPLWIGEELRPQLVRTKWSRK